MVGARSSVFAPLNIGIIILDMKGYEAAYKQDESPRYHARDVAIITVQWCWKCDSSLESRARAQKGVLLQRNTCKEAQQY